MFRHLYQCIVALTLFCFATVSVGKAQFYTSFSRIQGGTLVEEVNDMQVVNGETYLLGTTRSANFPVTNGSSYRGNLEITLCKFGVNGERLYATYIGGRGNDFPRAMRIVDGEVYLTMYSDSILFPVTNGSVFRGGRDVVVTRINQQGNIVFATYIGGNGNDDPATGALDVRNGNVYLLGTTRSPNFPVTNDRAYGGGVSDGFASILNAQDGSIIENKFFGGSAEDFILGAAFDATSMYMIGVSYSPNLPVSIGGSSTNTTEDAFITRFNLTNLTPIYARYLGGSRYELPTNWTVADGMLHLSGYTGSADYPVTNGTVRSTQPGDFADAFYTRLNPDGTIVFSTLLATPEVDQTRQLIIDQGEAYVCGTSSSTITGQASVWVHKILTSGELSYYRRFPIAANRPTVIPPQFAVYQNELYISGVTIFLNYPVTNQSQFFSGGTGFFTRLSPQGDLRFSTFLGSMNAQVPLAIDNGLVYLLGTATASNYPVTDSSTFAGGNDQLLAVFRPDGERIFAGYTGGSASESPSLLRVANGVIYTAGRTLSNNYPVTVNEPNRGSGDQYLTQMRTCPNGYRLDTDTLSPRVQTVCQTGIGELIRGMDMQVPGDSLPRLFRNGIAAFQRPIPARYQWQSAPDSTGPWTDIPGATFRDYIPSPGASKKYYRRASYTLPFCGSSFIRYSDTSVALVDDRIAPIVDAGGPLLTCPGSPVTLGGQPTASGGNAPYVSYAWDPPAPDEPNPTATVSTNTLYTLTVTDSLGCRQIDQALVLTVTANAGPDQGACAGQPALIGSAAIPGSTGLQYSWQPTASLNNPGIPQPAANPAIPTDYVLTLTVPLDNGNVCQTTDTVRVTPVAAPVNLSFAGPDKVFCLGGSALLGLPPESGFNYIWSPGSYLTGNTSSTTTYFAGNIVMPVPNPAIMSVTAQKSGCSFSDQTIVSAIEARAGRDGCGPRLVGEPDRTPDIQETYQWVKVSGSGNFTGPTDQPQVPVSASAGTATTYRLTVTYNGFSCVDEVTVVPACSNCQARIWVDAQYSCPSYSANGGNVTLRATSSLPNAIFTWSPQEGLNTYTGNVVQLTDNIPRRYTVTARDVNDSTLFCSDQVLVNDPAFVAPVFPAPDTITCANQPVQIGQPPVAGYSYEWTGPGLSGNLSSNPVATVSTNTAYTVTVTDIGGCILRDTVIVAVQNTTVNAGPDQLICSPGIVRLGSPAQPNVSYLWEPQASPWQNNSNEFSAQPEVLAGTDLTFILTATTSAGCTLKDTVNITLNSNPSIPDAPDVATCAGTAVRIGSPALAGVSYQWSPAAGLSNPNIAQPLANPANTTTYTVVASFPGNCSTTASDQVTVTVNSAFFNIPDISFCPGTDPVPLGTNAPPGMQTYNWQPATAVTNPAIANPSTLSPPPKVTSVYTLLVSNPNGCQFRDTIRLIPVMPAPQAGADRLICLGDSVRLGNSNNNTGSGIGYQWTPAGLLDDPNAPMPLFRPLNGGTFNFIVSKTDTTLGCTVTDTVVITVQDISFPVNTNQVFCQNSCNTVGTNPVAGIFYQWTPAIGLSDAGIANPVACVGTTGQSYTLTASNLNGCRVSRNIVLAVSPLPAAQISIPPVTACVGDTSVRMSPDISPPGPYRYLWSPNDGSLSDVNIPDPFIRIGNAGIRNYNLRVTDTVSGCTNNKTVTVTAVVCDPTVTVGDYMWFDSNANGLQDSGEPGLGGINVRLFNSAGAQIGNTTTNPSGFYFFNNVQPGSDYHVRFSLPAGYMFTDALVGGPSADNNSKANDTGRSVNFTVFPGTDVLNIDAGVRICGGGGPVPVSLLYFNGQLNGDHVLLYWQTANELNNDYFDIERSADGRRFSPIGRVQGAGNSQVPQSYSFPDKFPLNGMNQYRLKQVDRDGRSEYSGIIRFLFKKTPEITAVYIPGANHIRITGSTGLRNTHAVLFAPNGQAVCRQYWRGTNQTLEFKLPVLANGMYTLMLVNDENYLTRKLMIYR